MQILGQANFIKVFIEQAKIPNITIITVYLSELAFVLNFLLILKLQVISYVSLKHTYFFACTVTLRKISLQNVRVLVELTLGIGKMTHQLKALSSVAEY